MDAKSTPDHHINLSINNFSSENSRDRNSSLHWKTMVTKRIRAPRIHERIVYWRITDTPCSHLHLGTQTQAKLQDDQFLGEKYQLTVSTWH